MQLLFKVGNKKPSIDLAERAKYWRDGQLVDIRPDGYYDKSLGTQIHKCVIQTPHDYWKLRGTTDWKATTSKVYDLKKFLYVPDDKGRYPWDLGYTEATKPEMVRSWFVDFKWLLDQGWITQSDFESIYDKSKKHNKIYIDRDISTYLFHETEKTRLTSDYSDQKASWTSGTYTIGASGCDATDLADAESNLDAQFTGNVTLEHQNEETNVSAAVVFAVDINSNLLKLTAASGAEHTGGAYGNGARINFGTADSITVNGISNGTFEISKLAFDAAGASNNVVYIGGSNSSSTTFFNRNLCKGDSNSLNLFDCPNYNHNITIINSIFYGATNAIGIKIYPYSSYTTLVYNNTVVGCGTGIRNDLDAVGGTKVVKNNLCQDNGTDYVDDGGGFGTTSKNISEDATSPDAAYRSKDLHTNSVFKDYASNDYRLDSGGDATNLAIVDDGDDLSVTFTDDIQGQTRSTWYIGASEIVAAGGTLPIPILMQQLDQFNGGSLL